MVGGLTIMEGLGGLVGWGGEVGTSVFVGTRVGIGVIVLASVGKSVGVSGNGVEDGGMTWVSVQVRVESPARWVACKPL